jgi:hypothetical protein
VQFKTFLSSVSASNGVTVVTLMERSIYEYLSAIPCVVAPSVLHNDCT